MPGRKSNVSTTSNGQEEVAESTPAKQPKEKDGLSVEDLSLPKSMIARLAKGVLPANTQIHKDALLALHKSATVFVSYLASNSNDNAQASGKKTIAPQDVIAALKDAELEEFLPRLEAELKKYNEVQCEKRNTYRRKVKEEKAAAEAQEGGTADAAQAGEGAKAEVANGTANGGAEAEGADRPAKKLKGENGHAMAPDADDLGDDEEGGEDADEQEDDAEDDVADDEVEDEEEAPQDETMEDDGDEHFDDARSEISRDSALDDQDSD